MDFKISLVLEAPSFSFLLKRKLDVSLQLVFNNEDLDVENDERMLVILSILILFVHCVEKIWKRMTFFLEVSFDALVLVTRTIVFNKDMLESNILLKLNLFLLCKIKPPSNSIETSKDDLESERNCGMDEIET